LLLRTLCTALVSFALGACQHRPLSDEPTEPSVPVPTDAATDAGGGDASLAACAARAAGACDDDVCVFGCCMGSGNPGGGCAGCCQRRPCEAIPVASCPTDTCQVMIDCAGNPACTYRFEGSRPACGTLSDYGQDVECCPGLVKRCGKARADGSCDSATGGYNSFPWCLPCGDGVCDSIFENPCSCPEDCKH
jgi:hypothetical protein